MASRALVPIQPHAACAIARAGGALALVTALAALPPSSPAAPPEAARLAADDCTPTLDIDRGGALPTARLRHACALPAAAARAAYAALLARVADGASGPREVRLLIAGLDTLPELSTALARAARHSPRWNARRGAPRAHSRERFVAETLPALPEFTALFAGWCVAAVHAEKVRVTDARALALPAVAGTQLPFDALVWVTLSGGAGRGAGTRGALSRRPRSDTAAGRERSAPGVDCAQRTAMDHHSRSDASWFRSRGGRRFGLEFALIVLVKIVLLGVLWYAFFAPHPRPDTSPGAVERHLMSPAAAPEARDDRS